MRVDIKGDKPDDEKMRNCFPPGEGDELDPHYQFRVVLTHPDCIPPTACINVMLRRKPDSEYVTVVVLERGYDGERSKRDPVQTDNGQGHF